MSLRDKKRIMPDNKNWQNYSYFVRICSENEKDNVKVFIIAYILIKHINQN